MISLHQVSKYVSCLRSRCFSIGLTCRQMFEFSHLFNKGMSIVVDNTNAAVKIRAAWIELAKEEGAEVSQLYRIYDAASLSHCSGILSLRVICVSYRVIYNSLLHMILTSLSLNTAIIRATRVHKAHSHLPTLTYLSADILSSHQIRCVLLNTSKEICFSLAALRLADPSTAPEDRREIKKVGATVLNA